MTSLLEIPSRRCATAVGILVHEDKVLLVKHKKLKIWLAPGGHVDEHELPHLTAQREVFEETGIKVKAVSPPGILEGKDYYPLPFGLNLHWISQENYQKRLESSNPAKPFVTTMWPRGCEQHYAFIYKVEALNQSALAYTQNHAETDGIGWFTLDETQKLETHENIRKEINFVFAKM